MDVPNRTAIFENPIKHYVYEKGQDLMIDRNEVDEGSKRIYNRRTVIRDGKRRDLPFSIRFYTKAELEGMLGEMGMHVVNVYADWDEKPFEDGDRKIILVAKKGEPATSSGHS